MSQPVTDPGSVAPKNSGQNEAVTAPTRGDVPHEPSAQEVLEEAQQLASRGLVDPYDAVLLLSFGGPETPEEVMPFLERVTGGKGVPRERLEEVAQHYYDRGGKSPINDQCRALRVALKDELARRGQEVDVLWGNRNSEPFLVDTLRQAYDAGHRRVVCVTTSAYSSYSSCRQYREDLAGALEQLAAQEKPMVVDKIRQYWNHPGFSHTQVRLLTDAIEGLDAGTFRVLAVTHSIPTEMARTSGGQGKDAGAFVRQHTQLLEAVVDGVESVVEHEVPAELVYCSRSGSPRTPWLEPDICDAIERVAQEDGVQTVVVMPFGFVSDHMEVANDLDDEAREAAQRAGLQFVRVPTVGTDPEFVSGLVDLVIERAQGADSRDVEHPAWPGQARPALCLPGCCPNPRQEKPAVGGQD